MGSWTVFFSHETAVRYWRQCGSLASPLPSPSNIVRPAEAVCGEDVERMARLLRLGSDAVHVLVRERTGLASSRRIVCHRTGMTFPPCSFVRLSQDACVESPELSFVRMATGSGIGRLAEYGCEMAGWYALSSSEAGFRACAPVTGVERLRSYLSRAVGIAGVKSARRAAKYVVDGAASPMETVLYLLLCLPNALGGYGIPAPVMNARLALTRSTCRFEGRHSFAPGEQTGGRFRVCDLYWPEFRLAVEYDGYRYHASKEQLGSDAVRRNELTERGVAVITVTAMQIRDFDRMEDVARQVMRRLGMRADRWRMGSSAQRSALRRELLSFGGAERTLGSLARC